MRNVGHYCTYCGDHAQSLDHVIPKTFEDTCSFARTKVVPCCHECNSLLGDAFVHCVGGRADYVRALITERHNKVLSMPDWDTDELEDMSDRMRASIMCAMRHKKAIQARLSHCEHVAACNPTIELAWLVDVCTFEYERCRV